ncbi:hypothetical protein BH20ACT24_BH20ACT24_21140 [soil metagenome]
MRTTARDRPGSARGAELARSVTIGGVAGAVAGVLVGGLGGRLVMRLSAIAADPSVIGAVTENGNRVGEITAGGTIGLIAFGGLFLGISGGILFVVARPWLRWAGRLRGPVFGAFALATAGHAVIDDDNFDFFLLRPAWLNVLMFSLVFLLYGVTVQALTDRIEGRPARIPRPLRFVLYGGAIALGFLVLIPTGGFYFSRRFCFCTDPALLVGVFLAAASVATAWSWISFLRTGQLEPPRGAKVAGWLGLGGAFLAGVVRLATEVQGIA